jgi:hypothetical protein
MNKLWELLLESLLIIAVAFLLMLSLWPLMGMNVFQNLPNTVIGAQKYEIWNNTILYFGQNITKEQRPWHYLFVWFCITLPLATTALFFYLLMKVKVWVKNSLLSLLFLALFLNLFLYLILNPVIYNGPRHFLYLLPIIILIAGYGLVLVLKSSKGLLKYTLLALLVINYVVVGYRTIKLFPHHYVYFNELVGNTKGAQSSFETDYWGTAYKEAAEWVIEYQDSNSKKNLKIYACNVDFAVNYYSKYQFTVVDSSKEADLILCDIERDLLSKYPYPIIHSVIFDDAVLVNIRHNEEIPNKTQTM